MSEFSISPGDHDCAVTFPSDEVMMSIYRSDGHIFWTCPECGSRFRMFAERSSRWDYERVRPSSRRWKKNEKRRLALLIEQEHQSGSSEANDE